MDWWGEHLGTRYSVLWVEVETPAAAVLGTDASGWGSGQLAWLDGGREEGQLRFTGTENRRPVNWWELSGIVRAVELFGARLSGRTVLMETDNMAAKCSAAKGASHAPDMQELVRRLTRACERFHIRLKLTHTPGLKLDRPDHTSRGDLVEEPRQRMCARVFASLERAWGPFDSYIGPERQLASDQLPSGLQFSTTGTVVGGSECSWVHPTHLSVGPALRRLHECAGLAMREGRPFIGLTLVPDDGGSSAWPPLAERMGCVGRLSVWEPVLAEYGTGAWRTVCLRRPLALMVVPRIVGDRVLPVVVDPGQDVSWLAVDGVFMRGYSPALGVGSAPSHRVLTVGSFVYLPALEGRGSLLRVVEFYDGAPTAVKQMMAGSEDARPRVMCCIFSYFDSPVERCRCGGDIYDLRGGATKGLAFDAATLWHVDGLVSRVPSGVVAMDVKSLRGGTAEQMEKRGAGLGYERYRFDWQRAQDGVQEGADRLHSRLGWTDESWVDVARGGAATTMAMPLEPPLSFSQDSGCPPSDARFVPPASGYSRWTDAEGVVHLIYAPDVHLPLPPAYQRDGVRSMSVAEAVPIAAAAETARRALSLPGAASGAAGPSAASGAGGSSHPY